MGMAMESITGRKITGVSRNSDDFVPAKGKAGFCEHLLQNAYNSLYHNMLYMCDWDMFWTSEADARKHALLRGISGGPVYFSDRVGQTDADVLFPVVYEDGRILKLERSLLPTDDCIFSDPVKDGVLKLHNYGKTAGRLTGGICVFNLTDQMQEAVIAASMIRELDSGKEYVIFDWFRRKVVAAQEYRFKIGADEAGWYVFLPKGENAALLGRYDKYAGFTAAEEWEEAEDHDRILLHEAGPLAGIQTER